MEPVSMGNCTKGGKVQENTRLDITKQKYRTARYFLNNTCYTSSKKLTTHNNLSNTNRKILKIHKPLKEERKRNLTLERLTTGALPTIEAVATSLNCTESGNREKEGGRQGGREEREGEMVTTGRQVILAGTGRFLALGNENPSPSSRRGCSAREKMANTSSTFT